MGLFKLLLLLALLVASCIASDTDYHQQEEENDHQPAPLRVSVSQQIPFHILTKLPDGSYNYEGSMSILVKVVAEMLKRP